MKRLAFLLAISFLSSAHYSFAQESELLLKQVIQMTLDNEEQVAVLWLDVSEQCGTAISNAEPFDPLLQVELSRQDLEDIHLRHLALKTQIDGKETTLSARVDKVTRSGTLFSLEANVLASSNAATPLIGSDPYGSQGQLQARIEQPLLRGFLVSLERMQESASWEALNAVRSEVIFRTAEVVLEASRRYWDVAAFEGVLQIRNEAEQRAQQVLEVSEQLAVAGEVPRVDISQSIAQLEQARSRRYRAEYDLVASRQALRVLCGEDGLQNKDYQAPSWGMQELPEPVNCPQYDACKEASLVETAYLNRADLRALDYRARASQHLVTGLENDRLPQLDLFSETTLSNFRTGRRSKRLVESIDFNGHQRDLRFGVRVSYPLGNHGPEGRISQEVANCRRLALFREQIKTRISAAIKSEYANYLSLCHQIQRTAAVVESNHELVRNERERLRSGVSTLFVLIDLEDQLTQSQLQLIDLRRQCAQSLLELFFLSGRLVQDCGGHNSVCVTNLMDPGVLF